ncbi:inosine-uridine preferring nucleoside hydrolase-like [Antedon mediterranea]|uniref:inosine-uridine preferring nucleoside hydrolase-like n=1 Tax=Antedon mediterranea TaxID=105859 RepID=UPI003AF9AD6F
MVESGTAKRCRFSFKFSRRKLNRLKMSEKINLILDCDVGVDDALAVMLALATPNNINLMAITCVAGNATVDKVCINTLKVLKVCDRLDVAVYRGACSGIIGGTFRGTPYHGVDGMGDVQNIPQPDIKLIKEEVAAIALVRMVNERPGEISIAAIGPLTNIAIAMKLDPHFTEKVKEIVIMGGELEGRAAAFLTSEFNFTSDPEAVHVVLNESKCPIVIIPYEICQNNGFDFDYYISTISQNNKKANFIKAITSNSLKREQSRAHIYTPWDFYALAYLVDRSVVTNMANVLVQVELHGSLTRGKMVPDWNRKVQKDHNTNIIMELDIDKIKILFLKMCSNA